MLIRSMVMALLCAVGVTQTVFGQDATIPAVGSAAPAASALDNSPTELLPSDKANSDAPEAPPVPDVPTSRQEPEFPYYAIAKMLESLRQMALNPAQKAAVDGFYSVGRDRLKAIGEIRMFIAISVHRRFDRALGNEERSLEANAARALLATLTNDQKSQLRRKHRGAIAEAVQQLQMSEESPSRVMTSMSASTPMMHNDLLTAVQIPSVQDILQLTDEQFSAIEQVSLKADQDAALIVNQCLDELIKQKLTVVAATTPVSPAMEKLKGETDSILTEQQNQLYQKHLKDRREAAQRLFATDSQMAQQLLYEIRSHGETSETSTSYDHGSVTVRLKLTNYFARDEVVRALNLTSDQQTRIADSLHQAETDLTREVEEAATQEQKQKAEKYEFVSHKLNENLEAINQAIRAILTDDHLAYLQKEKFRGLGIASLKDPDVQSALELTDGQMQQIETILTRKPDGIRKDDFRPIMYSATDDFEKRSADMRKHFEEVAKMQEENNRTYEEHIRTQHAELWKVLSQKQIQRLQNMTGLGTPRPATKRI